MGLFTENYVIFANFAAKSIINNPLLGRKFAFFLPLRQIIIITYGLVHGKHSGKIQKVVTIDDLFT